MTTGRVLDGRIRLEVLDVDLLVGGDGDVDVAVDLAVTHTYEIEFAQLGV